MIATIPSIPNVCNCLPNIAKSSPTPLNASPNLTSAVANCSSDPTPFDPRSLLLTQ